MTWSKTKERLRPPDDALETGNNTDESKNPPEEGEDPNPVANCDTNDEHRQSEQRANEGAAHREDDKPDEVQSQ